VEAYLPGDLRRPQSRSEMGRTQRIEVKRLACWGREHQTRGRASGPHPPLAQQGTEVGDQRYQPLAARALRVPHDRARLALDRTDDPKGRRFEVQVLPAKPERLPGPEAGEHHQEEERFVLGTANRLAEGRALGGVQGPQLPPRLSSDLDAAAGVP